MSCNSYCEHGGICVLEDGHEGRHDSGYCQWDDKEGITKEKADKLMLKAAKRQGLPQYFINLLKEYT